MLTGAGRAFCVGQDLREHIASLEAIDTGQDVGDADPLATVRKHYNPVALLLAGMPKPVVAAVNGMAAGAGAGLAFLADFRIGGPKTGFLMAFANVGLAADTASSWTLPRLVGHAKATELLMLAEPVRSEDAARMGLLTQLVDDDAKVLTAAQEFAGSTRGRTHGRVRPDQAPAARRRSALAGRGAGSRGGCPDDRRRRRTTTAPRSKRSSPSSR